ncbi:MAG TPA: hypothetical protein VHE83_08775 [Mycobacteriales bacterium]|nr:hypothetical protein [Mycobacteriales bacterium]
MSSDDDLVTLVAGIEAAAVTTLTALFAGPIVTAAPKPVGPLAAGALASHRQCRDALNAHVSTPVLVAPDGIVDRLGLQNADDAHELADVLTIATRVDDLLTQTCVQSVPQISDPTLRALLVQVAAAAGRRLGVLRTLAAMTPGELALALGPPVHPTVLSGHVGSAAAATSFVGTGDALSPEHA